MTKQFDKLCKTCPTRLQPRVDTITEMIVNLDEAERQQIFANVEMRLSCVEVGKEGEMVGAIMYTNGQDMEMMQTKTSDMSEEGEEEMRKKDMKMKEEKLKEKMEVSKVEKERMKLEGKIEKNMMKLAEAKQRLESVTNFDKNNVEHDKHAAELVGKSEEELEICRLKAMEKVYKYERKAAESRLKLKMLGEPAMAKC